MTGQVLLEICVDTLDDLETAIAGGADRIELCSALALGGLTPSAGFAAQAIRLAKSAGVAIRAMVRPRDGDFSYARGDLMVASADGAALLAQGVDGLVFGAARNGILHHDALVAWVAAMRAVRPDAGLTLHRAIDLTADLPAAAEQAADIGFDCVLSSGGAVKAADGLAVLAAMQARVGDRITIMPGSGIRPENVADVVRQTGVRAVHASAAMPDQADIDPRVLTLGFAQGPQRRTRLEDVRALRQAIDGQS